MILALLGLLAQLGCGLAFVGYVVAGVCGRRTKPWALAVAISYTGTAVVDAAAGNPAVAAFDAFIAAGYWWLWWHDGGDDDVRRRRRQVVDAVWEIAGRLTVVPAAGGAS